MVENGVQFAGIVGKNRKKKTLDNALFLGVAEKLCTYVHFFLDCVHMRMARFFYFIQTTRNQGEQTMETQLTKKDIFAALESTGFGSPVDGSWLFDRWEDVATVAAEYIESRGVLSPFVGEEEAVRWAAEMLADGSTVDQAYGWAKAMLENQHMGSKCNDFCMTQDDQDVAAEYMRHSPDLCVDNVEAFVRAVRLWVKNRLNGYTEYQTDEEEMTLVDCAYRFLQRSGHSVDSVGEIDWQWRDCDEGALEFDLVLETAEEFRRSYDSTDWSVIENGCFVETAVLWGLEGVGHKASWYCEEGMMDPETVAEIEASPLTDILNIDEIGEWYEEIQTVGVDRVVELFNISRQVGLFSDFLKDKQQGSYIWFPWSYVADTLRDYLREDCGLFFRRERELPTVEGEISEWLELIEAEMDTRNALEVCAGI